MDEQVKKIAKGATIGILLATGILMLFFLLLGIVSALRMRVSAATPMQGVPARPETADSPHR